MAQFFRIIDYILFNIPFFVLHYLNCSCLEVSFKMNLRKKLLSKLKKSQFGNQSNRSFCILILSTDRKTKLPLYSREITFVEITNQRQYSPKNNLNSISQIFNPNTALMQKFMLHTYYSNTWITFQEVL